MSERCERSKNGLLGLISWQMVSGETRKSWSAPVPNPTSSSLWSKGRNSPSGVWRDCSRGDRIRNATQVMPFPKVLFPWYLDECQTFFINTGAMLQFLFSFRSHPRADALEYTEQSIRLKCGWSQCAVNVLFRSNKLTPVWRQKGRVKLSGDEEQQKTTWIWCYPLILKIPCNILKICNLDLRS